MKNLTVIHTKINSLLAGQPEHIVTIALILLSLVALLTAAYGTPAMKIGVALWFIAP